MNVFTRECIYFINNKRLKFRQWTAEPEKLCNEFPIYFTRPGHMFQSIISPNQLVNPNDYPKSPWFDLDYMVICSWISPPWAAESDWSYDFPNHLISMSSLLPTSRTPALFTIQTLTSLFVIVFTHRLPLSRLNCRRLHIIIS